MAGQYYAFLGRRSRRHGYDLVDILFRQSFGRNQEFAQILHSDNNPWFYGASGSFLGILRVDSGQVYYKK